MSSTNDCRTLLGRTLRILPLALALAATAACDRRDTEDDATATTADSELDRPAGTEAPAQPGAEASPGSDAEVASTVGAEPPDASETAAGAANVTQADALALLAAINEHEIAAADQALGKNVTGDVRAYAEMMRTEHTKNLQDTTRLGSAASTHAAVTAQKQKGEAELRTLDAQTGKAYEKAYMDAMVKGHEEALAAIDNTLLPAATEDNVRQHFTATRAAVAKHLERARQVRSGLQ